MENLGDDSFSIRKSREESSSFAVNGIQDIYSAILYDKESRLSQDGVMNELLLVKDAFA